MGEKQKYCLGCRDDFYNDKNTLGVKKCWGLKTAKVCTRWEIGTWTTPDTPRAFRERKTLSCYHRKGSAFYDKLPSFAVDPIRLKAER